LTRRCDEIWTIVKSVNGRNPKKVKQGSMITRIHVRRAPGKFGHKGLLAAGGQVFNCSLGRSGIGINKREGDGKTPIGRYRIPYGFWRQDRMGRFASPITLQALRQTDGWCDAPGDANYNRLVRLPHKTSHEVMRREDGLYDICLVLDYNTGPRSKYRGSAIFFHLQSPDGKPTEGCIALKPADMRRLLPRLSQKIEMVIWP